MQRSICEKCKLDTYTYPYINGWTSDGAQSEMICQDCINKYIAEAKFNPIIIDEEN